uniref:KRAB-related domain-containing protein n=1 Tax=Cebus imitator TaxID=2715852 RepID=A0A2K5PQQ6_CEBIM
MNGDDSSAKKPGDDEQISENKRKAFDDIAQYFSKKEWEKLKYSEKITYVYMKRNYEAMSRLGFQVTLPLFMRNKQAEDSQEDDSDRDSNPGNLVERRTMTFGMFQGLFPQYCCVSGHRENTHNIDRLSLSSFMGAVPGTPKTITHNRDPKGRNMPGPIDCVRERIW